LFHERGQLRLKIGDFRGAQEDFRSAVGAAVSKRDPILADDLIQLGQLLVRDNQAPEAVRAYELALAIRPDRIVAHRLLAQARLKMNQPDLAREALDRYLEAIPLTPGKAPTPEQAQILAQVYAEKGKALEAQAKAYRTRGLLDLLENDLRNSIDSYTHSLKFTRDSDTLSLRGWAYMLFNSPELAQIDFDEATKLAPREANGWIGRANARVRLGKTKEAILDVEEGLRLAGDDPRHLYNAARVFSLAVPPIRKNATPPPKTPETTQHATWERRAAQLLRKILEAKPEDERVEFWREYVEKDRAFENIRNGSLMLALKMEYDRLMK
jgi:tetratricopeptide (TPR) repeat protein